MTFVAAGAAGAGAAAAAKGGVVVTTPSIIINNMSNYSSSSFLQLSLLTHGLQLVTIGFIMMLLRVPQVASVVSSLLSQLRDGAGVEKYKYRWDANGKDFAYMYFEPLSVAGWVVHFIPVVATLELMTSLWRYTTTSNLGLGSHSHRRIQALVVIFGFAHAGGIFILLAHSLVGGVNPILEHDLTNAGFDLIRVSLFVTGPLLGLASSSFVMPISAASSTTKNNSSGGSWVYTSCQVLVLAVVTKQVVQDAWQFGNVGGIVMNTAALLASLFLLPELDSIYKGAYIMLAALPAYVPDSSKDFEHTMAAACVATCCLLQALSCRHLTCEVIDSNNSFDGKKQ